MSSTYQPLGRQPQSDPKFPSEPGTTLASPKDGPADSGRSDKVTVSQEFAAERRDSQRKFLEGIGVFAQIMGWLQVGLSVIAGIIVAMIEVDAGGRFSTQTDDPFVAHGFGIAFAGAALGVLIVTVGTIATFAARNHSQAANPLPLTPVK